MKIEEKSVWYSTRQKFLEKRRMVCLRSWEKFVLLELEVSGAEQWDEAGVATVVLRELKQWRVELYFNNVTVVWWRGWGWRALRKLMLCSMCWWPKPGRWYRGGEQWADHKETDRRQDRWQCWWLMDCGGHGEVMSGRDIHFDGGRAALIRKMGKLDGELDGEHGSVRYLWVGHLKISRIQLCLNLQREIYLSKS